jgi:hypothetical protein
MGSATGDLQLGKYAWLWGQGAHLADAVLVLASEVSQSPGKATMHLQVGMHFLLQEYFCKRLEGVQQTMQSTDDGCC